jgi:hypothetical protein
LAKSTNREALHYAVLFIQLSPHLSRYIYIFVVVNFPLYLQSVPIHSANVVKSYTKACRRVRTSSLLYLTGPESSCDLGACKKTGYYTGSSKKRSLASLKVYVIPCEDMYNFLTIIKCSKIHRVLSGIVTVLCNFQWHCKVFQKELYNDISNVTVWRLSRKRLHLKEYKLSIVKHL